MLLCPIQTGLMLRSPDSGQAPLQRGFFVAKAYQILIGLTIKSGL